MARLSLHSHSGSFCRHAKGTLEEVVQEAIKQGFTTYGLSEHAPRFRTQDLYPEESDLSPSDLSETFARYLVEAHRLKLVYRDKIDLLVGVEVEYINDEHLEATRRVLDEHGDSIEYLVGSVHHCREGWIDFDKEHFDELLDSFGGHTWDDKYTALLEDYFDAQHKVIDRLRPEVIGHFDLCRLYYPTVTLLDRPSIRSRIERNISLAVSYGALFEVNAAAFRKGWQTAYPAIDVLEASRISPLAMTTLTQGTVPVASPGTPYAVR